MSLQYIPKCVWWPLDALISAVAIFVIVFACMLPSAKRFEIKSDKISILVESTEQLIQINNNLQATISQQEPQGRAPSSFNADHYKSSVDKLDKSSTSVLDKPMLHEEKQRLEMINSSLQHIKQELYLLK